MKRPAPCQRRLTMLFSVLALWLGAMVPAGGSESSPVVLVTPINTVDTVIGEVILREAYRRLGRPLEIRKYPAERALRLADAGEVDGEVARIDGIAARYENLVQLRPAINYIEGSVFSRNTRFDVAGWPSLRPHRIGIIRGIKFAERNTEGMNVRKADDYADLFRRLERGQFDVAISPKVNGWFQIRRLGLESVQQLEPPLERFELFHFAAVQVGEMTAEQLERALQLAVHGCHRHAAAPRDRARRQVFIEPPQNDAPVGLGELQHRLYDVALRVQRRHHVSGVGQREGARRARLTARAVGFAAQVLAQQIAHHRR